VRSAGATVLQGGRATAAGGVERLGRLGAACQPSEEQVISGFGELILIAVTLLVVPIFTRYGDMDMGIAIHHADRRAQGLELLPARPIDTNEVSAA